jgi:hypothetical protein
MRSPVALPWSAKRGRCVFDENIARKTLSTRKKKWVIRVIRVIRKRKWAERELKPMRFKEEEVGRERVEPDEIYDEGT